MKEITLREWIKNFNEGAYESPDAQTQMAAGWYDWFCKDTSLRNKTKRMGNILKQIKDGGKVDLDKTYVWFKNNCPVSGGLFDDFRIANINNDETQLVIQINSPWENEMYAVYSVDDSFDKPAFLTSSSRELVKWLNEGLNFNLQDYYNDEILSKNFILRDLLNIEFPFNILTNSFGEDLGSDEEDFTKEELDELVKVTDIYIDVYKGIGAEIEFENRADNI